MILMTCFVLYWTMKILTHLAILSHTRSSITWFVVPPICMFLYVFVPYLWYNKHSRNMIWRQIASRKRLCESREKCKKSVELCFKNFQRLFTNIDWLSIFRWWFYNLLENRSMVFSWWWKLSDTTLVNFLIYFFRGISILSIYAMSLLLC